jgi:hypothetical protein
LTSVAKYMTPAASVCSRYTISSIVCKSFIKQAQGWVSLSLDDYEWNLIHIATVCSSFWFWYRLGLRKGKGFAEVKSDHLPAIHVYLAIGWNMMNQRAAKGLMEKELILTHVRTWSESYWTLIYEEGKQIVCVSCGWENKCPFVAM